MAEKDYIPVVERARSGSAQAFTDLVMRFQAMAVGSAYSWLGDVELAREISQEAFLDAHLHLHQLRSAAAFPGWFRKIVLKHCDRVTRQKRIASGPLRRIDVIRALFVYFCQPFVITEPFSGVAGEQVNLEDLLDDIESILRPDGP